MACERQACADWTLGIQDLVGHCYTQVRYIDQALRTALRPILAQCLVKLLTIAVTGSLFRI